MFTYGTKEKMKRLIKLLFKDNKLRFYVLVIIFVIASIQPFIESKKDYMERFSTTFENKEIPKFGFTIVEFDKLGNYSKLIDFKPENFYENLDKYVKENGVEKLILKDNYVYFNRESNVSVIEKNKEYILINYYEQLTEDYNIYKYKVYFNGKIVPVYFYMRHDFARFAMYVTPLTFGFLITLGISLIINFLFKIIIKSREKV